MHSLLRLSIPLLLLSACGAGGPPPSVSIVTPVNDATVSGTTAVQVTLDETVKGEVRVYARKRDSQESGALLGSANTRPYIVRWNTAATPAGSDLELYAKAFVDGSEGSSTPVRVTIQNATAPRMEYLVAYNLPAGLTGQSSRQPSAVPKLDPQSITGGVVPTRLPARPQSSLAPQAAAAGRAYWAEWSWGSVDGAAGYRVLMTTKSLAGTYDVIKSPAASANGRNSERYSQLISNSDIGDRLYGTVRSINSSQMESAMSNAGTAIFMDAQQVASPTNGQAIQDGRPILTWTALTGTSGYLYFLCDRPCTDDAAQTLWTNPVNAAGKRQLSLSLSAVYPTSAEPLPAGTYYWWVAGVRMENNIPVSLSYSEQRRLVVP